MTTVLQSSETHDDRVTTSDNGEETCNSARYGHDSAGGTAAFWTRLSAFWTPGFLNTQKHPPVSACRPGYATGAAASRYSDGGTSSAGGIVRSPASS